MRRLSPRRAAVIAIAALAAGCAFFGLAAPITVALPQPPQLWRQAFPGLKFTVVYVDGNGERREAAVDGETDIVTISSNRRGNTPILAYPWNDAVPLGVLRPAGGLFPCEPGCGRCTLSWEDGPLALVFMLLWEVGLDSSLFNGERLRCYLREMDDPWGWDCAAIAQKIATGSFTAYDIDPLPSSDVRVRASEGDWLLESPLREAFRAAPGGLLTICDLPYGRHTLFGPGGARISLFLDHRGVAQSPLACAVEASSAY
jgi:hypothetical protein